MIGNGVVGFGEVLNPDLTGSKLKFLTFAILEDGAVEAGFLAPGNRKGLALGENYARTAADGAVEQVLLGVDGTGLGGVHDYYCAGGNLFAGVVVDMRFATVLAEVGLGGGIIIPVDMIIGEILPEIKTNLGGGLTSTTIGGRAELPRNKELGPRIPLACDGSKTPLLGDGVELLRAALHGVFGGNTGHSIGLLEN